jgi:hypothetical protein
LEHGAETTLIKDPEALQELRALWNGVRVLRRRTQAALLGSFAQGASFVVFVADAAHNLPLIHAYAVLNEVLLQLEREGRFSCRSIFLGRLLSASESALPWFDFDMVKRGADRRNDVAHRGEVLPRGECWRFIDAVEAELVGWGLVDVGAGAET